MRNDSLPRSGLMQGLRKYVMRNKLDVILVSALVILAGFVSGMNMSGYPQRFEDEGTYISQAWAVKEDGVLAHYTYWYDHPPVGWIQIAGYLLATDAVDRYGSAISAGREFMLLMHLASIVLLFALARRLGMSSIAAGLAGLLYALSPLSIEYSRYVLLDNVAIPWLLAALLLALSPRRHIATAIGAAVCMAIAILSKETLAVLLPVVLYALWRSGDSRNRRYIITSFAVVFTTISAFYILYAALKNELLPGDGHVSLIGSLLWQLSGRKGSGSILDSSSNTYGLVSYWLNIDPYLLVLGAAGMIIALIKRSLRPAGLAMLIGVLLLLRTGYLPFPYVIVLLPFAALCAAGGIEAVIQFARSRYWLPMRLGAWGLTAEIAVALALVVLPLWQQKIRTLASVDADASSRQTVDWIVQNIPRSERIVVESALWADLERQGYNQPKPVWLYKTETDPAVKSEIGGWQGIDYIILNGPTMGSNTFDKSFPLVSSALKNGELAKQFGRDNQEVRIYKVNNSTENIARSR